jgi:hypothetical protein
MTFSGSVQEMDALLSLLDKMGAVGEWMRDREAEAKAEIGWLGPADGKVRCFRLAHSQSLPDCWLWLEVGAVKWSVSNIVPDGLDHIPPPIYSALLSSFRSAISPLLTMTSITVSEPSYEVGPEHWLSEHAVNLLHGFSLLANKSTGASHPRDTAHWNQFVIATHRDQCKIDGHWLGRILVENEHWPEAKANELAILFDYERSLLEDFDKSA